MSAVDPELVGRLFEEHASVLELYARQWCSSPQDIVQEAFLKLFRQTVWPHNVVPWLFRVVRNEAVTAARAARRKQQHERFQAVTTGNWFRVDDARTIDPAEVAAALATLPIEQREIIVAHVWGGLTFMQIAEITETSSSTAQRHYQAGILALRERLGFRCPSTNAMPTPI
jgi:RNA polymerase sigma-70 factor (ECF subfamily)